VLDFATSAVAAGKVDVASAKGEQLPAGVLVGRIARQAKALLD